MIQTPSTMTKKEIKELGIESTGVIFGHGIEIFKNGTKQILFNILGQDQYEVHPIHKYELQAYQKKLAEQLPKEIAPSGIRQK